MNISQTIDHTLLKATATKEEIIKICEEAKKYSFKTVCVPTCYVELASDVLKGTDVGITTVVGFPLGNETTPSKVFQAKEAIINGATDIDMVINIGALKDKSYEYVKQDILEVVNASKKEKESTIVKVIIETCYLTKEEITDVSRIVMEAGADFVKTSTGFGTGGALVEDVRIMKEAVGNKVEVKASGGISNINTAMAMIDAGATRLGVSQGIAIVKGEDNQKESKEDNY